MTRRYDGTDPDLPGGWVHEDGTPCPEYLAPADGTRWWCSEHEKHLKRPEDGLPPKWHEPDYAQRKADGIRSRPPMYRKDPVLNDDIEWLLDEIGWLNKQLTAARTAREATP